MLRDGHINHHSEYALSSTLIYSTLIAIVLRDCDAAEFYLLYDGAVDMQIGAHPTRRQCKVSNTQVTVKAYVWASCLVGCCQCLLTLA